MVPRSSMARRRMSRVAAWMFCISSLVEGVGFARGMDAGGEEDLVHVDVAEARHYGLVEKQGLHAGLATQGGGQVFHCEVLGERVGAEA